MAILQNMSRKQQDLQEQFDLLSEKIGWLRKAFIIETDPSVKFKLEKQLEDAEAEREQLEQQLDSLEREIKAQTASKTPQRSSDNVQQASDRSSRIEKQDIPADLHNRIVDVLTSLPNIQDKNERRALIYSAGLDQEVEHQLEFDGSTLQFCHLLVKTLGSYGTLKDGRHALVALLNTAKNKIGQEGKARCDELIRQMQAAEYPAIEIPADQAVKHPKSKIDVQLKKIRDVDEVTGLETDETPEGSTKVTIEDVKKGKKVTGMTIKKA